MWFPTTTELSTLLDSSSADRFTNFHVAINLSYFPDTSASNYWSSNTGGIDTDDAWYVYFHGGGVSYGSKAGSEYVRAVRGGQ